MDVIKNEAPDFLHKNRYLNETLFELSSDFIPLRERLLPSLMETEEYFIDPIVDMDIHYHLKSIHQGIPKGCFFTSKGRYVDFETCRKYDLPAVQQ